jgi:hypothetical protein
MSTPHHTAQQAQPPQPTTPAAQAQPANNSLATISLVLGIISLTGPGLILGIPAIITGAIALKKKQGERGLSITGLVTGIVSTVVSLLILIGLVLLFIFAAANPGEFRRDHSPAHPSEQSRFEENRT